MKRIVYFKCEACGMKYDTEDEAMKCEARHAKQDMLEIAGISHFLPDYNDFNEGSEFPEKIVIRNKGSYNDAIYQLVKVQRGVRNVAN